MSHAPCLPPRAQVVYPVFQIMAQRLSENLALLEFRVPKIHFMEVHSNSFTIRYHTPLSAAESPRGVLGCAKPNIKLKHAKQGGETQKKKRRKEHFATSF